MRLSMSHQTRVKRIDQLVGAQKFVRKNPKSDLFPVQRFHHIEFWCPDATSAFKRFQFGLGMDLVAKTDHSTGNSQYGSYVLKSNELVFAFTAPYSSKSATNGGKIPHPDFKSKDAFRFVQMHGFGVRSIGIIVDDAKAAFEVSVSRGAVPVLSPVEVRDDESGSIQVYSEVRLYGDVVLRYVSGDFNGPFLAQYTPIHTSPSNFGLDRLDHAVGNVHNLLETANYVMNFTGFHEFAEFVAEDVGTVDSGLNSVVLASNNEYVLLPINEPTFGTRRKSQIQTYLEQNEGHGVQHLALNTKDIIGTIREMKAVSHIGGFGFMPPPSEEYYRKLPRRIGNTLTAQQYAAVEELGILVDRDEQGTLLQIFTMPLSDRPTIFLEIIQRIGCETETTDSHGNEVIVQKGGCGGFGKGNFTELFKSVEFYESTLAI